MDAENQAARDRRLPFEGAANFRDLGGYRTSDGRTTRWKMVYRSDSLADMTERDLVLLASLGVKTLCDFRLPAEAKRKPNRLPAGHAIRSVDIGFLPTGTLDMLSAVDDGRYGSIDIEREVIIHYRKFIRDHAGEYSRLFALLLADGATPLLMHCTSGKDRTGFGSAAFLKALGVPRETIIADYALTNDYRRDIAHLFSNAIAREALDTLTSANPRYIETALDEIDIAYGSTEAWLESLGVDGAARKRLVERYTE